MPMPAIHFNLPSHLVQRTLLCAQTLLLRSYCRRCSAVLGVNAVYAVLCPQCASSLPGKTLMRCACCAMPSKLSPCLDCKKQQRLGQTLYPTDVVCDYDESTKEWLHFFKSTGHGPSALLMAQEMATALTNRSNEQKSPALATPNATWLVPVPSSRERLLQRGFNPAALLATALGAALNLKRRRGPKNADHVAVRLDLVIKKRHTKRQGILSRQERLQNLDHAFALNQTLSQQNLEGFKGSHLIVIDDVITTGATMQQMCTLLTSLQPAFITRIAFARTGLPNFVTDLVPNQPDFVGQWRHD
jgi:ComF family protein